jgi:hypothetical protein
MKAVIQVLGGRNCPAGTAIEVERKVQDTNQGKYLQTNLGTHSFEKPTCLLPYFVLLSGRQLPALLLREIFYFSCGEVRVVKLGRGCRKLGRRLSRLIHWLSLEWSSKLTASPKVANVQYKDFIGWRDRCFL